MASLFTELDTIFSNIAEKKEILLNKEESKPSKTQDRFKTEVQKIFKREGGYVNDPADPGGETIYGISRRSHPSIWAHGVPSMNEAEEIYRRHYWDQIKGDYLPPKTASVLMDHAVLSGTGTAIRDLNRSLGLGDSTSIDDKTLDAISSVNDEDLAGKITNQRISLFERIAQNKPKQSKFLNAWIRRAHTAYREAGAEGDLIRQDAFVSSKHLTRGVNPDSLREDDYSKRLAKSGLLNYGIKQSLVSAGRRLMEEKQQADDIEKNKNVG